MGAALDPEGAYEPTGLAEQWRRKAEECRTIAERMRDPVARESFLQIAVAYEHRAVYLEKCAAQAITRSGNVA